jgi:hypothetical protein
MRQSKQDANINSFEFHINQIQSIINRMATNSFKIKQWYLTVIGLFFTYLITINKLKYWWLVVIVILTFMSVDIYYLLLEKQFRNFYQLQIDRYHNNEFRECDLYLIKQYKQNYDLPKSIFSYSIMPLYIPVVGLIISWFALYIIQKCQNREQQKLNKSDSI